MALVSILSIFLLSLLAAALSVSNLSKLRTNAFVDGNSAFYVAEAGLNKRSAEINKKLKSYAGVQGIFLGAMKDCYGVGIPAGGSGESTRSGNNDFECVNYRFQSSNNIANVVDGKNIALDSNGQNQNTYVAYTFIKDNTRYDSSGAPPYNPIPAGEQYAGLNAAEYKYVVSAVGKKPVALAQVSTVPVYTNEQMAAKKRQQKGLPAETGDPALITAYDSITAQAQAASVAATNAAKDSSSNTTLSMTFSQRVIPLFQFAIFYNGDLELNPTSGMQVNGWVHSNANMYLQPSGLTGSTPIATFLAKISAIGKIYNRVDAWPDGVGRTGITRVLLTGSSCVDTIATPSNCKDIPDYSDAVTDPLTAAQINDFTNKVKDNATLLKTPSPGFTRKRNYADNKIGEYFSKADMRLEMVPDRDVTSKTTTPWTRNNSIIPFNFTAIRTGGTGACTTTAPTAGSDPAANYVDPERDNVGNLRCNIFTKGQLQSLRQPVMVLTDLNQNRSTSTLTTAQFRSLESTALGAPTLPTPPTLSGTANTNAVKQKIIRALQVAIASTPKPIRLERLDNAFNTGVYAADTAAESLQTFKTRFSDTIATISELNATDRFNLLAASPKQIAALRNAWFLPAPIQRIEKDDSITTTSNPRSSGFYDGREKRWITMLQTNIASLSVWNRDGLYVTASDSDLTTAYSTNTTNITAAFAVGVGANFTDGLAFDRATTFTKDDDSEIYPVGSLQYLGLGSSDKTEGGLVFHATVNDDLDGNGTLVAANDITVDKTDNSQRILKKTSNNTNELDASGNVILLDYYRKYPGQTGSRQSPFGFAFNGGNYLPNALVLSSDQSIYLQGNFNNNSNNDTTNLPATTPNTPSPDRLPAAVVADTITVLSNECVTNNTGAANFLGVPLGQLKCGLPLTINGATQPYDRAASAIAINAAFLSNTQVSRGNLGTDRGYSLPVSAKSYSGGANNYIRLLEDWSNSGTPYAFNYSGSLISLGEPVEYNGAYRSGGRDPSDPTDDAYYNIPFRNVNYDLKFSNIKNLPPLTPKASYIATNSFFRNY